MSKPAPKGAPEATGALSVLMLGPYNSPHIDHLAVDLTERGHGVHLAGVSSAGQPATVGAAKAATVTEAPRIAGDTHASVHWLRDVVERTNPDLIHAHCFNPLYTTAPAVSDVAPLVITTWGSDLLLPKPSDLAEHDKLAARLADAVTADSRFLADQVIELGAEPSKVRLLRWGVDLGLFKPAIDKQRLREQLGLGPGPLILSPRAATPIYNIPTIVEAFERVADHDVSVQLVLKYFATAPPDLSAARHRDRIHLVGDVPYERMPDYYAAADVCVSIASSDSAPRSVWEAMACGCPCVVSDLPWVPELIEAGTDALVVPIDGVAVEAALRRLLSEPELRESIASRGRALVEEHHDKNDELDSLEDIYTEVAGASRPGRSDVVNVSQTAAAGAEAAKDGHIDRVRSRALLSAARFGREDHVLDFGCGDGRLCELLASRVGRVTGVDLDRGMVRRARQRSRDGRCEFLLYDGERLPFMDGTLAAAVTVGTLEGLCAEPQRFRAIVAEIVRTLRPGGGIWMLARMVPSDTNGEWSAPRWRSELESSGARVDRIRPVRTAELTRIGSAVLRESVPDWLLTPAARLDLALARRRGVRRPYTECLVEAHRP